MLENGYIKMWRTITTWSFYKDINTTRVFIHLLLTVTYKDSEYEDIVVKKGSRIVTENSLMEETNLSRQNVRTALKNLQKSKNIKVEKLGVSRIITVLNYEKYQANLTENTDSIEKEDAIVEDTEEKKKEYAKKVTMTEKEYQTLVELVGEDGAKECIETLSFYKMSKNRKYTSDYGAIRKWVVKDYYKNHPEKVKKEEKTYSTDMDI